MRTMELHDPERRAADAPLALQGVRVVDFSQFIAGPYCSLILADFGAEVIKIENPSGGDDMRRNMLSSIGGESGPYLWANRNKRSVALDLRTPDGRKVARELIDTADILIENFSADVMSRLGLDYGSVSEANPRLVYCSISACGREGELAGRVGFDPIAQAESGLMSVNAPAAGEFAGMNVPIVDMTSGMMACNGVLAALYARTHTGRGQEVQLAMFDQAVGLLGYHATGSLIDGSEPAKPILPNALPMGTFKTADGSDLYICCANDRTFAKLMVDVLDRPELAADERFSSQSSRFENAADFIAIISEVFLTDTREAWLGRMRSKGVPVAPVVSVTEALRSDEVRLRRLVSKLPHPTAGSVPHIAPPFQMSHTPVVDPVAAPTLGRQTREVLRDVLGYPTERLRELAAAGVFGSAGLEDLDGAR